MKKQRYCLGFLFSEDLSRVVLIKKNKPEWQAGKLNGVGGKIEDDEIGPYSAHKAMSREFEEETGAYVCPMDWNLFASLEFPEAILYCFARQSNVIRKADGTTVPPEIEAVHTATDEEVRIYTVEVDQRSLDPWWKCFPHMPNLEWLIPMARQSAMYRDNEYTIKALRLS